jgi:hypothetical protein
MSINDVIYARVVIYALPHTRRRSGAHLQLGVAEL